MNEDEIDKRQYAFSIEYDIVRRRFYTSLFYRCSRQRWHFFLRFSLVTRFSTAFIGAITICAAWTISIRERNMHAEMMSEEGYQDNIMHFAYSISFLSIFRPVFLSHARFLLNLSMWLWFFSLRTVCALPHYWKLSQLSLTHFSL